MRKRKEACSEIISSSAILMPIGLLVSLIYAIISL